MLFCIFSWLSISTSIDSAVKSMPIVVSSLRGSKMSDRMDWLVSWIDKGRITKVFLYYRVAEKRGVSQLASKRENNRKIWPMTASLYKVFQGCLWECPWSINSSLRLLTRVSLGADFDIPWDMWKMVVLAGWGQETWKHAITVESHSIFSSSCVCVWLC